MGGFIVSATLRAPSNTPISAGSWSLIAYSATSLPRPQLLHIKELDGAGTQEEGMTYRFGSMYSPNKHLRLFRDILEVPQACFPLSINLDVIHTEDLPVRFVIGESTGNKSIFNFFARKKQGNKLAFRFVRFLYSLPQEIFFGDTTCVRA